MLARELAIQLNDVASDAFKDFTTKDTRNMVSLADRNPKMAFMAALMYCYGTKGFVGVSYGKAFEYASYAARNGEEMAYFFLGCLYATGRGTETDVRKALYWFDRSSKTEFETKLEITVAGRTYKIC